MAISQIAPTLGAGSEYDLEAVSTWANTNAFGRDRCSLTEWDTTTVPELAEGSIFETGGAYYQVDSDTAITVGAVSDGFVFILVNTTVPAVPTLQFTNSVPVWDASKFGYYDTGTNYKALPFIILKATSSYTMKGMYDPYGYLLPSVIPMFEAEFTSTKTFPGAAATYNAVNNWDSVKYNYNSSFTNGTGIFTVQTSGIYNISFYSRINPVSTTCEIVIANGTTVLSAITPTVSGAINSRLNVSAYFDSGDSISLQSYYTGTASSFVQATISGLTGKTIFSCQKVG